MKKFTLIIALYLVSIPVFTQVFEKYNNDDNEINTLFGNYGGGGAYLGFGAGYSAIDGKDGIVINGRAAWIAGHNVAIGITGTGFINDFHFDPVVSYDVNLSGGYGGLLIEPIILPKYPVHISIPVTAGIGGIAYTRVNHNPDPWEYHTDWVLDEDVFFVFEPGVELEFNVLKFFRMGFGITYRMTSDIDLVRTAPDVLDGLSYGVSLKFGRF